MGSDQISRRLIIGYSVGSLGTGVYLSTPSVLLLYFMTDTLGIAAGLASLAIFIPRVWDVITDPIMGLISDRTRSRWGRRRPYLLIGALLMSLSFVFLFSVPEYEHPNASFWHVLVVYICSATAYTIFAVPYISMPAEMSTDPHERTVILSYRMGFAMAGLILGMAFAPMLVQWFGGGRSGYSDMSILVGLLSVVAMLVAFRATRDIPSHSVQRRSAVFHEQVAIVLRNRPFFMLAAIYQLQIMGVGVLTATAPYFVSHVLGKNTAQIGAFFLFMIGTSVVSMPLWSAIARRYGKRVAYKLAAVGFGVSNASLLFATDDSYSLLLLYAQGSLIGIPFGGIMMIPFSMLTDTIQHSYLRSGVAQEGVFTGLWTACEKIGLAIGPLIAGLILSAAGFVESVGGGATQTDSVRLVVLCLFGFVPALLVLSSVFLFRFYELTEAELQAAFNTENQVRA